MSRKIFLSCIALCVCMPLALISQDNQPAPVKLSVSQIIERNVSALGGLEAWRAVTTMMWAGKMEAGGKENTELPFVLRMKRPLKSRLEIGFKGDIAVQVYDGINGWKLRPFLGRREMEPYTEEEMKAASAQADLDGPLVDYAAKGTNVELEAAEKVENRDAYKLKLTLKNGQIQHIWVDAQTFLEVKQDGTPRRLDGKFHPVAIYFRDYKPVEGLLVPYVTETVVEGVKQTHKMTIVNVVVNPALDDSVFAKPTANPSTGKQEPELPLR
jgi:outer membrane lipoprotein-sorting protein